MCSFIFVVAPVRTWLEAFASLLLWESLASCATNDRPPIVIRARDAEYFFNQYVSMMKWHALSTHSA